MNLIGGKKQLKNMNRGHTSYNTAYTLQVYALALCDIAPFSRSNAVYVRDVIYHALILRVCKRIYKVRYDDENTKD